MKKKEREGGRQKERGREEEREEKEKDATKFQRCVDHKNFSVQMFRAFSTAENRV